MSETGIAREMGYWWLPENEDNKVPGTLEYSRLGDTRNLKLSGTFRPNQIMPSTEIFPVVHGFLKDGTSVSLLKCVVSDRHMGGITSDSYNCSAIVYGTHIDNAEQSVFSSGRVLFTMLQEWVAKPPFEMEMQISNTPQSGPIKYSVHFRPKAFSEFELSSIRSRLAIDWKANMPGSPLGNRVSLRHMYFIKLSPEGLQGISWYLERFQELRCLLTLLIGEPIYFASIDLSKPAKDKDKDRRDLNAQLYSQFYGITKKPGKFSPGAIFKMLAPYPIVEEKHPDVFNRWFLDYPQLMTAYATFFSALLLDEITLEHRFLTLMQAIESFHRHTRQNEYMLPDEYRTQIEPAIAAAIPEAKADGKPLPEGLKDALLSRIRFGNEYSLRKRIYDLLSSMDPGAVKLLTTDNNVFVSSIVDVRNRLTHRTKDSPQLDAVSIAKLYKSCDQIEMMMIMLIMDRLEFNPDIYMRKLRTRADNMKAMRLI